MMRTLLFLVFAGAIIGCSRRETVERYPGGEPKRIHIYAWPGAQDSLHLRRTLNYSLEGQPVYEAHYRGGKLNGEFKAYWNGGQVREQGNYRDGKQDGKWTFYFNRFTPSATGSFREGLKEGLWTEYWEDNNLRRRGEYRRGKPVGEWVGWSALGAEIERNSCYPENARGRFQSFFENGSPKENYECRNGMRSGSYSETDAFGNILRRGFYDSVGRQDSLWESFQAGEKPASRRKYRSGLLDDSVLAWDAGGRVVERGFFHSGTGILKRYDSLGVVLEVLPMVSGKEEGENWKYHPNGLRRQCTAYRDGIPQSIRRWHPNGKKASEGRFRDGKKTGLWNDWDSLGALRESAHYENGLLHGEQRFFDSTGALTRVQKYFRGMPSEGWFPKLPGGMKKKNRPL